jgi:hypothetical protein
MSAVESRWVTKASINKWEVLYGKDSNQYKVEVLGEFPDKETDSIIGLDKILEAVDRRKAYDPDSNDEDEGDIVWGVDCGGGGDNSVLIKRRGRLVYDNIKMWKDTNTMKLVGRIVKEYNACKDEDKPTKICIDSIALGKGAADRLKELKLPVVFAIASGKPRFKKFNNSQKSEWWSIMRDWFLNDEPMLPDNPDLIEQLSTVRDKIISNGKFCVEEKKEYKRRNKHIGSPDIADALAMTFIMKKTSNLDSDSISFI